MYSRFSVDDILNLPKITFTDRLIYFTENSLSYFIYGHIIFGRFINKLSSADRLFILLADIPQGFPVEIRGWLLDEGVLLSDIDLELTFPELYK
jgi:hypothetical protein